MGLKVKIDLCSDFLSKSATSNDKLLIESSSFLSENAKKCEMLAVGNLHLDSALYIVWVKNFAK